MDHEPLSPPLRQDPPTALVKRGATVATAAMNTIRVPHDRYADKRGEWYGSGGTPAVVAGNQVKYLLDADEAFQEMAAAIRTATSDQHFIYMVNWFCDVDFPLLQAVEPDLPGARTNLRGLLSRASDMHVMVRAMFWQMPTIALSQNVIAIQFLNSIATRMTAGGPEHYQLKPGERGFGNCATANGTARCEMTGLYNAAAIHDQRGDPNVPVPVLGILPAGFGAQHQKFLCVFGEQGLICFCGGVDFNPDRIAEDPGDPGKTSGGHPLHDVHCRIVGPAALELVQLFKLKWTDHPRSAAIDHAQGPLIVPAQPATQGEHVVQVGRTFGRTGYRTIQPEQSAADMIAHAIRNAKRFIYTECQYFTGTPKLLDALLDALGRIEHLTVVLTHWEISDLPTVNAHRRQFIGQLKAAGGDKVRIFTLQPDGNTPEFQDGKVAHTYVHSKIWIVDDEFMSIGSVNSNRRSWSHDAEVAAGIYETSTDAVLRYRLAHWMRIQLWQEHLGLLADNGSSAELTDGVASAAHWLNLTPGARVRPYKLDERNRHGDNDIHLPIPLLGLPLELSLWDSVFDPE